VSKSSYSFQHWFSEFAYPVLTLKHFSPEAAAAIEETARRIAEESHPLQSPEEFISLKTASARFDIPLPTLKKWLRTGQLRKHKIQRCVRVRVSDLLADSERV
jgi:hypothetical protein